MQQVDQTPSYDRVVVQSHYIADHRRGDSNSTQIGGHLTPYSDGAFSQPLADGEFQIEDGYALDAQHYEVGDEKGTSAILLGQIRKAPDVAKANSIAGRD